MRTATLLGLLLLTSSAPRADDNPAEGHRVSLPDGRTLTANVVRVNARGGDEGGVIVEFERPREGELEPLVEGWYLALGSKRPEDPRPRRRDPRGAMLLRLHLAEVLADDRARLAVDPAVIDAFETIDTLLLFRPRGTTTATMQSLPAAAPIVDESDLIEGLSAEASRHLATSKNNLRRIGLALHNHLAQHRTFPPGVLLGPDGKPWHSWRVLILPHLDQQALYDRYRFDEPWDGPNNKPLIAEMPDVFHDPVHGEKSEKGFTSYAGVVGPDAALLTAKFSGKEEDLEAALGRGVQPRQLTDGFSNTLMVGSVSPEAGIPWTKPEDLELGERTTPTLGGMEGFATPYEAEAGRAGVFLWCDGSMRTILATVEPEQFRHLLQRNDRHAVGSPPSLDPAQPGGNLRRVPVLEYRETPEGPRAVLTYDLVPSERRRDTEVGQSDTGSAPVREQREIEDSRPVPKVEAASEDRPE
jgi:hypothetical protein